ncbi:hypothetical protein PAHAL_1G460500 [Panicum hallii]|uniref:Uncharacterized protein n=1 Tax=Panicum hallii TaxID=206008 RepID=A0A2S3GUW3_9POAL|nr:hypothetical protein PAHAL_1G460500 [Panicum hallii]
MAGTTCRRGHSSPTLRLPPWVLQERGKEGRRAPACCGSRRVPLGRAPTPAKLPAASWPPCLPRHHGRGEKGENGGWPTYQ